MSNKKAQYSQIIKHAAKELGFFACGISEATFLEEEAKPLTSYLEKNYNGQMNYMANHFDMRLDPRILEPGAKSVISLLLNYYPEKTQTQPDAPKLAKYAYGKDYHFVIKDKLRQLKEIIDTQIGEVGGRAFVDSAPVLDRAWAKRSGLGWVGKNGNLINQKSGSFFFIAELIIDLKLDYDQPINEFCGTCTRCVDACPTQAIISPKVVDGSKCISYFTIELRDQIPTNVKGKFDNWMFGCDTCQDVCPWNRKAIPHTTPEFNPHPDLLNMTKEDWMEITEDVFRKVFQKSAVKRTKYQGLIRNLDFLKEE